MLCHRMPSNARDPSSVGQPRARDVDAIAPLSRQQPCQWLRTGHAAQPGAKLVLPGAEFDSH